MPRKKLPMRKISEILRLRAAGKTKRPIAASVGVSRSTVHEYLARAKAAGVGWPLPEGMDEAALDIMLFPPPTAFPERRCSGPSGTPMLLERRC